MRQLLLVWEKSSSELHRYSIKFINLIAIYDTSLIHFFVRYEIFLERHGGLTLLLVTTLHFLSALSSIHSWFTNQRYSRDICSSWQRQHHFCSERDVQFTSRNTQDAATCVIWGGKVAWRGLCVRGSSPNLCGGQKWKPLNIKCSETALNWSFYKFSSSSLRASKDISFCNCRSYPNQIKASSSSSSKNWKQLYSWRYMLYLHTWYYKKNYKLRNQFACLLRHPAGLKFITFFMFRWWKRLAAVF